MKKSLFLLFLALAGAVLTGCAPQDRSPAGGGLKSAADPNMPVIDADAIVMIPQYDGVKYITKQQYLIKTDVLAINSLEPSGSFFLRLGGGFSMTSKKTDKKTVFNTYNKDAAVLIHQAVVQATGLSRQKPVKTGESVKIEGIIYDIYETDTSAGRILFYESFGPFSSRAPIADNYHFGIAELKQDENTVLAVKIYNYLWIEGLGKFMPTKFDLLRPEKRRQGKPEEETLMSVELKNIDIH